MEDVWSFKNETGEVGREGGALCTTEQVAHCTALGGAGLVDGSVNGAPWIVQGITFRRDLITWTLYVFVRFLDLVPRAVGNHGRPLTAGCGANFHL